MPSAVKYVNVDCTAARLNSDCHVLRCKVAWVNDIYGCSDARSAHGYAIRRRFLIDSSVPRASLTRPAATSSSPLAASSINSR